MEDSYCEIRKAYIWKLRGDMDSEKNQVQKMTSQDEGVEQDLDRQTKDMTNSTHLMLHGPNAQWFPCDLMLFLSMTLKIIQN